MRLVLALALALLSFSAAGQSEPRACAPHGVQLQVLGAGGTQPDVARAGSGFLVWIDGRARVLIDIGYGTARRLAQTGADLNDIQVVLLTQTHVDHTADLPALVQAAWLAGRQRPLPIHGPAGNRFAASTVTFVRSLFDPARGAWRHLGNVLNPMAREDLKLVPHDVRVRARSLAARRNGADEPLRVAVDGMELAATPVVHGIYPALAWRVRIGETAIVVSGDMNGEGDGLVRLARGADVLVASHAIVEGTGKIERFLHMPPSVIGQLAAAAGARELVLVHRSTSMLAGEKESLRHIRQRYANPVHFADDLSCYAVGGTRG